MNTHKKDENLWQYYLFRKQNSKHNIQDTSLTASAAKTVLVKSVRMYEAVDARLAESSLILQSTSTVGRGQTNITGPQHVVGSTRVDCSADSWTRSEYHPERRDS